MADGPQTEKPRSGRETTVSTRQLTSPVRPSRILAGDIGGTHSRLAIYNHRASRVELLRRETYSSSGHPGLTEILATFLHDDGGTVDAACLGIPAPMNGDIVRPPNLPWQVDRQEVHQAIGTDRVALINDVEASAAGLEGLSDDELICLQAGTADPHGNRAVLSLGTGLGVSALTPAGRTFATEAGHATFAPSTDTDFALQAELQREFGHVSWERIASGSALPRVHALLAPNGTEPLEASEIVRRADSDPVCRLVIETFRRHIGAAAGNIALTLMASGGLYVTGGVATRVLDTHNAGPFLDAFRSKGRMRPLLERIPVFLVREPNLALRGAARKALALVAGQRDGH